MLRQSAVGALALLVVLLPGAAAASEAPAALDAAAQRGVAIEVRDGVLQWTGDAVCTQVVDRDVTKVTCLTLFACNSATLAITGLSGVGTVAGEVSCGTDVDTCVAVVAASLLNVPCTATAFGSGLVTCNWVTVGTNLNYNAQCSVA